MKMFVSAFIRFNWDDILELSTFLSSSYLYLKALSHDLATRHVV